MIKSFDGKDTEQLWHREPVKRFRAFETVARRKLRLLNAAVVLEVLRVVPGNRLEMLKGDRKDQWSIRINKQWRLCFRWKDGDAYDVEIVDYH